MDCATALDKYLRKYERAGGRGLTDVRRRVDKHLRPYFGHLEAEGLTTRALEDYADHRAKQGVKDTTIRAELAALRRALRLSYVNVPALPDLVPGQPRRGYLSIPDFARVREALPRHLQGPITMAYLTGWRLRSEVLPLRREWVNLEAGLVSIPTSKNKEPRRFPIDLTVPEVGSLRDVLVSGLAEGHPLVFTRGGRPIRDFRVSWSNACSRAGLKVRPHDLRRSAATNLHRAGIQTKLAMKLVGHKTIQTHLDYVQDDDSDLREAVRQFEAFYTPQ